MINMESRLRCAWCGRFIGYKNNQNKNKIKIIYIPESPFTIELLEYYHANCVTPIIKKKIKLVTI